MMNYCEITQYKGEFKQLPFIFLFFYLIIFMASCIEKDDFRMAISRFEVQFSDDYVFFELDSVTSFDFQKWRFNNATKNFYFFNSISRSIYIYHIGKEHPIAIVPIDREGPNGIPKIDQIYLHNLDSIFVFSEVYDHVASLINSKGVIINRFILSSSAGSEPLSTLGLQFGKDDLFYNNDKLYLTVGPRVENYKPKNIYKSLLIFDIHTHSKEYVLDYLDRSRKFNFGPYGSVSYGLLNPFTNNFVIGFPYDHSLIGFDISSKDEIQGISSNPFVRLASTSIDDYPAEQHLWYYYRHGWYDKLALNPIDTTIWRMSTVGLQVEQGQNYSDPTLVNIHGGKENFFTFIYDKDLQLKGYVNEFLHLKPILFSDGNMYKFVPNSDPLTAESRIIFRSFHLVEKHE